LFIIPPPATPSGWTIEWRWRLGECDWTTGEQKSRDWQHYGTYRCSHVLRITLRRARYTDHSKRKEFRVRVTLYDYQGDIQLNTNDAAQNPPF